MFLQFYDKVADSKFLLILERTCLILKAIPICTNILRIKNNMRRTRRPAKTISPPKQNDTSSSDDEPLRKKKVSTQEEEGSSESDLETYLKPADQIDLNSSFFAPQAKQNVGFDAIEKDIFSGIQRLSDSDSDEEVTSEQTENVPTGETQKHHFENLNNYNEKLEDVKRRVEEYNAKKKKRLQENNLDVESLLARGEASSSQANVNDVFSSLHSSDFESVSESEREDWEEVKTKEERTVVPKDGVEIRVQMPDAVRKKKGFDLMAAIKRRMNRVKKETQVYVHKVHLLSWIAHGNYINNILNSNILLGLALSLLPSQHCYPSSRLDLTYLQQILTWYGKAMSIRSSSKTPQAKQTLEDSLQEQISKREAQDYKMFVYIFICVLRSLGVSARLVLSLQVEPLRPPISELCSLSNKTQTDKKSTKPTEVTLKVGKVKKNLNISKKDTKNLNTSTKNMKNSSKVLTDDVSKKKEKTQKKKNVSSEGNEKNSSGPKTPEVSKNIADYSYKEKKTFKKALKENLNEMKAANVNKANSKNKIGQKEVDKPSTARSKNLKTSTKAEGETKLKKSSVAKLKGQKSSEVDENLKIKKVLASLNPEQDGLKPLRRSSRLSVKSPTELDPIETGACGEEVFVESDVDSKREEKRSHNFFKVKVNLKRIKNSTSAQSSKGVQMDCNSPERKLFAEAQVKCEDDIEIQLPQVDGANDTSESDTPATVPRKQKPNFFKLKSKSENTHATEQRKPSPVSPSKKDFKDRSEAKEEKQGSNVKKLSLKKLRTPLDVKLANLRDLAQSSQSSSDSDRSRFFSSSPPKKLLDVRNDIMNLVTKGIAEQKEIARSKLAKHKRNSKKYSDDEDYTPEAPKKKCKENDDFKKKVVKVKRRIPMKKDLAEIERVEKEQKEEEKKKKGVNVWVEVFAEAEEKWISVDVTKGKLHCVSELYARATNPVCYILAWDNDNYVKDITKRYCAQWNTVTRKLRVDPVWWNTSLKPFMGPRSTRNKEEDDELAREQLEKPLPTTISEYKDHPLYVLKRHLLKFQALYPPNAATLGFIRNEPVYSRDCVYVLHSRELWLKEAKVVKVGEQPYKIVKARPKYDKLSNSVITDRPLEIFGIWQVEDYVPPSAENGIVPRNAYGNVELFKPCMLPKGTVHLQLPGLNKVARKMNIDCAPAVTGFDFHGGWNHAIYDGFIVCEEHADKLVAGWYMEQEEAEKRAQEKLEKRVYDNWRKLIKGLLIRERLKARYDFGAPTTEAKDQSKKAAKGKSLKLCIKKRRIKSDSESD